jgi:3-hydroxyisobutyrate dehydrogenase-like beta-hydroxyacid dehydrogenase
MLSPGSTVCFIGFGEAGGILGEELARQGLRVKAWDLLLANPAARDAMRAKCAAAGVGAAQSLADGLRGAQLVVSAVTASSAADVARDAGALLKAGQCFMEINSISPDAKRANARVVEAGGAEYVEAAVMAPVPPLRLRVPMLLGGASAEALATALRTFGMDATAVADRVGVASAIKMCRSVMIKGLESLTVECLRAARHYGAEDAVLKSLAATFPSMGWDAQQPDYLISRVAEHGRRRAAEMREVAATVEAAGLEPLMSRAIAEAQDALVDAMDAAGIGYDRTQPFAWRDLADRLD